MPLKVGMNLAQAKEEVKKAYKGNPKAMNDANRLLEIKFNKDQNGIIDEDELNDYNQRFYRPEVYTWEHSKAVNKGTKEKSGFSKIFYPLGVVCGYVCDKINNWFN